MELILTAKQHIIFTNTLEIELRALCLRKRDQDLGFIIVHALRPSRLPGDQGLDTDLWVKAALSASLCNEGRSQECSLPRVTNAICKCHPMAGEKKDWLLLNSIIGKVYSFFTQFLFLKFAYKTSPGFLAPPRACLPGNLHTDGD